MHNITIKEKKNILMICYYYPPLVDVGCKRSVAFAKYLKCHGWDPHVLSVRNPDKSYCHLGNDRLPNDIPTHYVLSVINLSWIIGKLSGIVSRVNKYFRFNLRPRIFYDILCIPDYFIGWIPGSILSGYKIIRKYNLEVIYVSCSPFSSAITGIALKKITKKPLVVDFRDPMAVNLPFKDNVSNIRKKINIYIEKKIIYSADVFIVNTDEVRQGYVHTYPDIRYKTYTIHNGFDHQILPATKNISKYHKYTIAYAGNMYFSAVQSMSFFEALAELKQINKISSRNFQFLYYGPDLHIIDDISYRYEISDLIKTHDMIPHTEMIEILSRSHLQLLRIIKPMISTKLFEGIALNLPFLATIPEGEVAQLIQMYSPSSYIVHEDSAQTIKEAIISAMQAHENGQVQNNAVDQFLVDFSREAMTRKLEMVIEKC